MMKTCPICERPMRHTRLYGYQCSNPDHAGIANQIFMDWMDRQHLTLEQFVGGYPEHEREMVRRVIGPELPGWPINNATESIPAIFTLTYEGEGKSVLQCDDETEVD